MFGFGEARDQRDEVYNTDQHHESHLTHELLGGGVAFEAMKQWEDSQRRKGEPVEHSFAKEVIAGLAGAEIDKLVETKGLDWIDREKAKYHAKKQSEHLYDQQYSQYDQYNPNEQQRHEHMNY